MSNHVPPMVGNRYGLLTVMRERPDRTRGSVAYDCHCECGAETVALGRELRSGRRVSCGCRWRKGVPQRNGTALSDRHSFRAARYGSARIGAESRGIEWHLTKAQWSAIVRRPCVMCGDRTTVGVDRFDSTLGYTESNTVPMCWECNKAKGQFSMGEFRAWIDRVVRHSGAAS